MTRKILCFEITLCLTVGFFLAGCGKSDTAKADSTDTAPPAAQVEPDMDVNNVKVDDPGKFPVVTAGSRVATTDLNVTGVIGPDVAKLVPVMSTATGKVVEIKAKVGDVVQKDQLMFTVHSNDIAGAFSDYRKAVVAEQLAKKQLIREKVLLDDGAIPASQLEIYQSAEDGALVDVDTTRKHLAVLGSDPDHPTDLLEMHAPLSGVVIDQQITNSAAVQAFAPSNPSPGNPYSSGYPFTISDMSDVWIVCDVFENVLSQVHMDGFADVRLNAYPDRVLKGRISNIGQILDPVLHTAKVRIELPNPGFMRIGMFATATFKGDQAQSHAVVPSSAILNLHDNHYVYTPGADKHFKRLEVVPGDTLPKNADGVVMQEVVSGIKPGDKVVSNALVLQSTVEQ